MSDKSNTTRDVLSAFFEFTFHDPIQALICLGLSVNQTLAIDSDIVQHADTEQNILLFLRHVYVGLFVRIVF